MTKLIEYNWILVTHPEWAWRNPWECDIFIGYQHWDKTKPIMSIRYMTLDWNMIAMNLQMEWEVTDIREKQLSWLSTIKD